MKFNIFSTIHLSVVIEWKETPGIWLALSNQPKLSKCFFALQWTGRPPRRMIETRCSSSLTFTEIHVSFHCLVEHVAFHKCYNNIGDGGGLSFVLSCCPLLATNHWEMQYNISFVINKRSLIISGISDSCKQLTLSRPLLAYSRPEIKHCVVTKLEYQKGSEHFRYFERPDIYGSKFLLHSILYR